MLYCDAPFAGGKAVMDSVPGPYFKRTHKPFLGFFALASRLFTSRRQPHACL